MNQSNQTPSRALAAANLGAHTALNAVVTVDAGGRIILFNAAAERLFNCAAREAVGSRLSRFIPDRLEGGTRFFENVVQRAQLAHPGGLEIIARRADGTDFPVDTSISKLEVGGEPIYSIIVRDITERLQQDLAARLLASIVSSSSDAIASKDLRGIVTSWNTGAERMFGYSAAEMVGQPITRIIPTDRLREEELILSSIALGETVEHFETVRLHRDGRAIPVSVTVSPIRDAKGEIVGASKVVRDVTQRQRLDTKLRETRDTLQLLIDQAPVSIAMFDRTMRYVAVSQRWVNEFGGGQQDLVGRSHYDVAPPAIARKDLHDRALRGELMAAEEEELILEDGESHWFRWAMHPWRDTQGQINGIVMFAEDITARRRAETRLRESDARFRHLAESLPQLIWTCDETGNCDYLSRQWIEYTGIPADAQLGRGWLDRIHRDDRLHLVDVWQKAVAGGTQYSCEFRIQRHDGVFRWFEARGTPLRNEAGKVVRWYGTNTDIEERRRAEEARMRIQKLEALGTLAGGIAHDFNNILLAICGNVSLALEEPDTSGSLKQYLQEIDHASRRAAELVRRILSFSRQNEPRYEAVSLQKVAAEVRSLMRATLPAQIELRFTDTSVPPVAGDESQIHQVLMNLLTNAAHAIGSVPGQITLSLGQFTATADCTEPGVGPGEYVRVSVADTGCGMTEATRARIFDPFFTTKPVGQGTGLGLSVVDGIMKQHHGAITVWSEVRKGSRFDLYFPVARESRVEAESVRRPSTPAHGERVLYVDDDAALVLLATRKLTRLGYAVKGMTDPVEALELIRLDPRSFDVVVTDLSMPRMTGFELSRQILEARPDMPIIVTSGFVGEADEATAAEIGVHAFILKPHTIDELGSALGQLFTAR